jgi:hypothetical protein
MQLGSASFVSLRRSLQLAFLGKPSHVHRIVQSNHIMEALFKHCNCV